MLSDFFSEEAGYLTLTNEEILKAKETYPELVQQTARAYLEYGENKEGNWTSKKFMEQIKYSAKIQVST